MLGKLGGGQDTGDVFLVLARNAREQDQYAVMKLVNSSSGPGIASMEVVYLV